MYPNIIRDIKSGLFPITTLVRNDFAIETGQLTAKQSRKSTSQMLKFAITLFFYLNYIVSTYIMIMRTETLECCFFEFLLIFRIGD